jgi:hypothetical protein
MNQADTMQGKRVIMSDKPRWRMMVPKSPEPRKWKVNLRTEQGSKVKVTSGLLLEKYARQQRESAFHRLRGVKR